MRVGKHRPAHASNQQCHQNSRKTQHHIAQAHQETVNPAAHETGQQTHHHTEHNRDDDGRKTHRQRDARAVHQGRQNVAALVVGAQQKCAFALRVPCRRQTRVRQLECRQVKRIVRRNEARKHGAHQTNKGHHCCGNGHGRGFEAVANIGVKPARDWISHGLFDVHPFKKHEVVGHLYQLDFLVDTPGQCLLVQRQVANVVAVQFERLGNVGCAFGFIGL